MGRRRRQLYGTDYYPADQPEPPTNSQQSLAEYAIKAKSAEADYIAIGAYMRRNANGEYTVNKEKVEKAAASFEKEVVTTREYSKEEILDQGREAYARRYDEPFPGGTRAAQNAINREAQARARAILALAKVGDVKLSPYQKRILNASAKGEYVSLVYGERGQYEQGTLATRAQAAKAARGNSNSRNADPAQRARARELADNLRASRYGDYRELNRATA